MKRICLFPCAVALILSACNSGQPLQSGSDFDPLVAPGMNRSGLATAKANGMKKGTFVHTIMDNAAFFKQRPKGNADADRLLKSNTEMKVISDDQSYVKVELNSGEIGFVPTVQVSDETAAAPMPSVMPITSPGAVQVYPRMPGGPLPSGPVQGINDVPTIPPVIEPDATPAPSKVPDLPPAPPVTTPPPVTPPVEKPAGE